MPSTFSTSAAHSQSPQLTGLLLLLLLLLLGEPPPPLLLLLLDELPPPLLLLLPPPLDDELGWQQPHLLVDLTRRIGIVILTRLVGLDVFVLETNPNKFDV